MIEVQRARIGESARAPPGHRRPVFERNFKISAASVAAKSTADSLSGLPLRLRVWRAPRETPACPSSDRAAENADGKDTDFPAELASCAHSRRICVGVRLYVLRMAALNRRTHPNPDASATSFMDRLRFIDQLLGEVQAASVRHRARRRAQVPHEQIAEDVASRLRDAPASPSIPPLFQATLPDQAQGSAKPCSKFQATPEFRAKHSGRQRRHGRNPASAGGGSRWKVANVFLFHGRYGQMERQ